MSETRSIEPKARQNRSAVAAMYTGLGLTIVVAAVPYAATGLLADHIGSGYPTYADTRIDAAVTAYLVLLSAVGGLGVLAWVSTIWATRAGKRWARPAATAMFTLGASVGLAGLLTTDTSGDTGLPMALGLAGMIPPLVGLVAVVLLWRRPA